MINLLRPSPGEVLSFWGFTSSLEINWRVTLFPKIENLFSYVPCSPIFVFVTLFPSKFGICSPEINALFPLFPQTPGRASLMRGVNVFLLIQDWTQTCCHRVVWGTEFSSLESSGVICERGESMRGGCPLSLGRYGGLPREKNSKIFVPENTSQAILKPGFLYFITSGLIPKHLYLYSWCQW